MFIKIILCSLVLLVSVVTSASETLDLAGRISAWRCQVGSNSCSGLGGPMNPNFNFTVKLELYGSEWRGKYQTHHDLSGYRFVATYNVSRVDFYSYYRIDVSITVTDPKGTQTTYRQISAKLERGKELSPYASLGRVVHTEHLEYPEKLTPVVFLGPPNETFDGLYPFALH